MNSKLVNLLAPSLCAVLLILLPGVSVAALELTDLNNPRVTEAFVDGFVLPMMKSHHSPSGTVAIMKNGQLIFAKGYGYQDLEKQIPVDAAKTLFRPGSVSKLFTWVSVMQMVEQGKLDLDVDINTYLKTFQIEDSFAGQPVTMRHIMTHTAGFEDGGVGYVIIDDPSKIVPLADSLKAHQPERVNPPGVQTAYSNYATAMAGLIVANLSGMSFEQYVQQSIFNVLDMRNSTFVEPLPNHLSADMAVTYDFVNGQYKEKPFEIVANFSPAGSASATATDMVKFAQALLNGGEYQGGRILKTASVNQMLTRNFSQDDRIMGMALGIYETEVNGVRLLGHGGATYYFKSELKIDLDNNIAFFVSFGGPGGGAISKAFAAAFYGSFLPQEKRSIVPPSDFENRAAKYAGTYEPWRGNFSKLEKVLGLADEFKVTPTANNTLVVSRGGSPTEYVEVERRLFEKPDGSGKLAFQENDTGEITGFVIEGRPFESTFKAPFYFSSAYNFIFLGLSIVVFIGVLLRFAFQWPVFKQLGNSEKAPTRASIIVASANIVTVILGLMVLAAVGDRLKYEIPTLLIWWLILPILATLAGLYHFYRAFLVWKESLLGGVWARVRYSIVAAAALFFCWFYYFWNILGFQFY